MALNAGNADCTTGLSQRLYVYWTASSESGFVDPLTSDAARMIKAQCYAFARGVVDEIEANLEVEVVIAEDTIDAGVPTVDRTFTGEVP
jgi:hypothetical protein